MKRPLGVVLAAVVLGIIGGLQLLFALGSLGMAAMMGHVPAGTLSGAAAQYPPGTVPPSAGLIGGLLVGYAIFLLILAAWAIVTLVGLVRLKDWARNSVLVIGGCMAGFGLLALLGVVATAFLLPAMQVPTTLPANTMRWAMAFDAFVLVIFTAIGVWWVVYFNRKTTRAAFAKPFPAGYEPAYVIAPEIFPALPADSPLDPPASSYPAPGRWARVPVAVIVIGCLLIFGGVCSLLCMMLPYEPFVAGFTLDLVWGKALYMALGLFSIGTGRGLLRLDESFRRATLVLLGLGALNTLTFATPWGRDRFLVYNARLTEQMHLPTSPYTGAAMGPMLVFSAVFGLAIYGLMAWLLHHYRGAFVKHDTAT